jgi:hypothetical protein
MTAPRDTGSFYDAEGHRPPGWVTGTYTPDPIVAAAGATGGTKVTGWLPAAPVTNPQVDHNWGNSFPMQPNDDRDDTVTNFGGGEGDNGYAATYLYGSDTLRTADYDVVVNNVNLTYKTPADGHDIEDNAWSGFPAFLTIPRLVGDSKAGAIAKIDDAGLTLGTVTLSTTGATVSNDGTVKSQSPVGGDGSNGSETVDLVVFDLTGVVNTIVPNVVGMDLVAATAAIEDANLIVGTSTTTATGATEANDGNVKSQTPKASTVVDEGTAVNIVRYAYVAP